MSNDKMVERRTKIPAIKGKTLSLYTARGGERISSLSYKKLYIRKPILLHTHRNTNERAFSGIRVEKNRSLRARASFNPPHNNGG